MMECWTASEHVTQRSSSLLASTVHYPFPFFRLMLHGASVQ